MFKYTLNPKFKYYMFEHKPPNKEWWNAQWKLTTQFAKEINVEVRDIFVLINHLKRVNAFYSKDKVDYVPVGGRLIPEKHSIL